MIMYIEHLKGSTEKVSKLTNKFSKNTVYKSQHLKINFIYHQQKMNNNILKVISNVNKT